ncbi:glycoside hydrolase family 20 zincin-like fold domain-containing protein [Reichenbachiella sp. MALMAid0571]|uniref:glycoside hydrolase family 20 zincin-like fold domain-containing protein n=1 Tax=Reichenbachiella sp. MALMAid0571 TaxID=3143939 RepID=UPI0032DED5AD
MKKIQQLFLLGCLLVFFSCQFPIEKSGNFELLPYPQEFTIEGVSKLKSGDIQNYYSLDQAELPVLSDQLKNIQPTDQQGKAQIVFSVDSNLNLPEEGYELNIAKDQIIINGKDKAGLFYGFKTLEQLLEDAKEQNTNLPLCSISDYPLLTYRSIHLDIKHHMETKEYYYALMDKLASYKVNGIIVELEDKLKYERQPEVGAADAWSIDEWKKLSEYANARNIEISPLVQGLGHASFILKHDTYKPLRDDPESDWAFNPLDPETYKVQFDLYLDAIEATPNGKYLHIGGDEVHTTGRNSGKSQLELQLIWLDKVSKFAAEHGRTPIFWDDMPLKHADVYRPMFNSKLTKAQVDSVWAENEHKLLKFLDQFPKNCIYMRWNYSNSDAIGNGKAMEWFRNHGMEVMGATAGQTRWVLMPQAESNMNNIRSFALTSIDNGLKRLLLTLWDDDSPHFELYMRGILAFAEYTWSGEKRPKEELKAAYRHREFSYKVSDSEYAFIDQLETPVAFWKNALLKGNSRNYLMGNENAMQESVIDLPKMDSKGEWTKQNADRLEAAEKALVTCDSVAIRIAEMKKLAVRNSYNLEVYEQVNELVRFSCNALIALKTLDQSKNEEQEKVALLAVAKLNDKFKTLKSEFESVYGKTRILTKPDNFILDQDHHRHLANQTTSFDWQFYAEMLFLEKLEELKY